MILLQPTNEEIIAIAELMQAEEDDEAVYGWMVEQSSDSELSRTESVI